MSGVRIPTGRGRPSTAFGDAMWAALITVVVVLGAMGESYPTQQADRLGLPSPLPHVPAAEFALVALAGLVLVWRRRWPVLVWAVSLAATLAYTALDRVNGAVAIAPMVALYTILVTRRRSSDALGFGLVTAVAIFLVGGAFGPFGWAGGGQTVIPFVVAAVAFLGLAVANRRSLLEELAGRAERAERTREDEARRRVDAERVRIARELHDVVAHTMAMISVQAAAALHTLDDRPERSRECLVAIRAASKDGLRELRSVLAVLREVDEPRSDAPGSGSRSEASTSDAPAVGLASLSTLVASCCSAGLPTHVNVRGRPRQLPPEVDLAAYRIIQESLTNTLRHAGPAEATVILTFGEAELEIDTSDTGHAEAPRSGERTGHGLEGMAERVRALAGSVETGPSGSGGFRVHARLPIEGVG